MGIKLDWVFSLKRIGVAYFSGDGILGTLQVLNEIKSGLDSSKIEKRLSQLEDPIGSIHSDVASVSRVLYNALEDRNKAYFYLTNRVFDKYKRPLFMLNKQSYISFNGSAGSSNSEIIMNNPYFIIYAAALSEKNNHMNQLVKIIESSMNGQWLNALIISEQVKLPVQVVNAFFEIYSSKGLGDISKEGYAYKYHVIA